MVLMAAAAAAAAADHHPVDNSSPPSLPSAAASTRTPLHGFSFPSWGTHRFLRCSRNEGSAPSSASPPKQPHEPSTEKEKSQETSASGASLPQRPWNLRSRRSATTAPNAARWEGTGKAAEGQALHPPVAAKKRGFSVALTKEEITADFIAIRGTGLPRRPKKRSRGAQRDVDAVSPGLSLADVNLDSYKR
ncbi:hypothetical protein GUJ93_ZPchr0010g8805 [Zizania palustris]|uniref:Uncharacterized protein n=1 Tax=Zizania palustris TaxID=103762 RepID=A0A8J5WBL3_ZIZPA|nr:hypothetical protein GUJ93_ZPchr0010g8805 [Zizania palustris]